MTLKGIFPSDHKMMTEGASCDPTSYTGHRLGSPDMKWRHQEGFPIGFSRKTTGMWKKCNKVAFYGWYPSTVAAHVTLIMINFSYGCIWLCKIHAGDIVLSHNVFPINLMTILEMEWYYLWRQNSSSGTTDVYVSTYSCGPSILIKTAPVWCGVKCVVLECKKYVAMECLYLIH